MDIFDIIVRIIEVGLVLATVFLMYKGYRAQRQTSIIENRPYLWISDISSNAKTPEDSRDVSLEPSNSVRIWTVKIKNVGRSAATNFNFSWFVIADNKLLESGPFLLGSKESRETVKKFEREHGCITGLRYHTVPFSNNLQTCLQMWDGVVFPGAIHEAEFQTSETTFQGLLDAKDKSERSGVFLTITYSGPNQGASEVYFYKQSHLPYRDHTTGKVKTKDFASRMN